MSTRTWFPASNRDAIAEASKGQSASDLLVPIGRAFFASIFVLAGGAHFDMDAIQRAANQGVPLAYLVVPASGVVSLLGGLSVLVGYRAKLGAALLAFFLVTVTFTMHAFWAESDAQAAQLQTVMFFKNVSILGGAMLIACFGAGPYSFDASRSSA